MKYEVLSYYWFGNSHRYQFETLEEIVDYYWTQFVCGLNPDFRVINNFDRQRVDLERLWVICRKKRRANFERYYARQVGTYDFRGGPVPGIRCRRGRKSYGCRYPKTMQEIRETAFLDLDEDLQDMKIKIRKVRRDLPTRWDDIPRGDYKHRSWKRHRNTQYKEV